MGHCMATVAYKTCIVSLVIAVYLPTFVYSATTTINPGVGTLSAAVKAAGNDDTLVLQAGLYTEEKAIHTLDKGLTLIKEDTEKSVRVAVNDKYAIVANGMGLNVVNIDFVDWTDNSKVLCATSKGGNSSDSGIPGSLNGMIYNNGNIRFLADVGRFDQGKSISSIILKACTYPKSIAFSTLRVLDNVNIMLESKSCKLFTAFSIKLRDIEDCGFEKRTQQTGAIMPAKTNSSRQLVVYDGTVEMGIVQKNPQSPVPGQDSIGIVSQNMTSIEMNLVLEMPEDFEVAFFNPEAKNVQTPFLAGGAFSKSIDSIKPQGIIDKIMLVAIDTETGNMATNRTQITILLSVPSPYNIKQRIGITRSVKNNDYLLSGEDNGDPLMEVEGDGVFIDPDCTESDLKSICHQRVILSYPGCKISGSFILTGIVAACRTNMTSYMFCKNPSKDLQFPFFLNVDVCTDETTESPTIFKEVLSIVNNATVALKGNQSASKVASSFRLNEISSWSIALPGSGLTILKATINNVKRTSSLGECQPYEKIKTIYVNIKERDGFTNMSFKLPIDSKLICAGKLKMNNIGTAILFDNSPEEGFFMQLPSGEYRDSLPAALHNRISFIRACGVSVNIYESVGFSGESTQFVGPSDECKDFDLNMSKSPSKRSPRRRSVLEGTIQGDNQVSFEIGISPELLLTYEYLGRRKRRSYPLRSHLNLKNIDHSSDLNSGLRRAIRAPSVFNTTFTHKVTVVVLEGELGFEGFVLESGGGSSVTMYIIIGGVLVVVCCLCGCCVVVGVVLYRRRAKKKKDIAQRGTNQEMQAVTSSSLAMSQGSNDAFMNNNSTDKMIPVKMNSRDSILVREKINRENERSVQMGMIMPAYTDDYTMNPVIGLDRQMGSMRVAQMQNNYQPGMRTAFNPAMLTRTRTNPMQGPGAGPGAAMEYRSNQGLSRHMSINGRNQAVPRSTGGATAIDNWNYRQNMGSNIYVNPRSSSRMGPTGVYNGGLASTRETEQALYSRGSGRSDQEYNRGSRSSRGSEETYNSRPVSRRGSDEPFISES